MKKLSKYLLWAFGVAWVFQIIAGILYRKGNSMSYSVLLAVSMFAPLFAAVLSGTEIRSIGWKPHIKGNLRWILVAWFAPVALGAAGAALYFLLVPNALDTTFAYIRTSLGVESLSQLESAGLSVQLYALIGAVSAMTYAPFVNMLFAVGEEAGWRGTMYPILKDRFGIINGRLLGGAIWGVWHWPIMLLAGYEYGTTYWGAPVTGPLLFCVITIAMGILFDFLYEKTNCTISTDDSHEITRIEVQIHSVKCDLFVDRSRIKGFMNILDFQHISHYAVLRFFVKYLPFMYGTARKHATTTAENSFI